LAKVPTDPKTNLPYEYQAEGDSYSLCLTFEGKEEGRKCFTEKTPVPIINPTDVDGKSPLPSEQL
jgi:hypothetical protein